MEIFIVIVLFIASVFAFMKFAPVFGGRPDLRVKSSWKHRQILTAKLL
ncbi:hypothetical protein [Campylobacter concisus]